MIYRTVCFVILGIIRIGDILAIKSWRIRGRFVFLHRPDPRICN
jgi:hypothetical protein